ncbi:hypothetical protein D3C75_981670 [compost metagenome]
MRPPSSSRMYLAMPRTAAMSPPSLGVRYWWLMRVAAGVSSSAGLWGLAKRSSATSLRLLKVTIWQPWRAAWRRAFIMRGWLVPGFWPNTKIALATSKSSSTTVPLPTPTDWIRPTPLASWHMLEQSGKLLVP